MVLVMASFAMPTPSAREVNLVINVNAHVEMAGEGMGPTVPVSCEKLGIRTTREQEEIVSDNLF